MAHENAPEVLVIYGIKGPSGIGMLSMFENPPQIPGFDVSMEALSQADLVATRFISGEAKMGILPPNMAAKIASSGINIQIAAVTGNGMLSLLSLDPDVHNIEDLRGKRVEIAGGAGASPDYVLRRLLLNRGIDPDKDLTLGYALAPPEIAQSLAAGRISTALLPEPFASIAVTRAASSIIIRKIGDIQDEWKNVYGSVFPMTVFAVDADFAASHPDAMTIILQSLEDSIDWIVSNPAEAGELSEKHNMGTGAAVTATAIPVSNYVFVPAVSAKPSLETLFGIFLEFSPESIGNVMPKDSFYYQQP